MPATATQPAARAPYRATRDTKSGALTVHGVPIFVECERGEHKFGADWIDAAVAKAKRAENETGYLPPLHVWHHEDGKQVVPAGHFRITGTERGTFKGADRTMVMADLVITNPAVEADVLARRLPYRSVEIHKVAEPALDSLALLDHEAPYLELPMLMVGDVQNATFKRQTNAPKGMAIFRSGDRRVVQFAFGEDDKKDAKADEKPAQDAPPQAKKAGDENEDAVPGEEAAEQVATGPGTQAVIDAINDGSIPMAEFQALVEAIKAKVGAGSDQPMDGPGEGPAKAPAPTKPGEQMRKDTMTTETKKADATAPAVDMKASGDAAVQMAALQGEVEGLKAKVAASEAEAKAEKDVAAAMKRLEGRPLGADLEPRLVTFRKAHGEAAFAAYVDSMEKAFGVLPKGDATTTTDGKALPEVAMKYAKDGAAAIDRAAALAAEWEQQQAMGARLSMSQDRYVEINMRGNRFANGKK